MKQFHCTPAVARFFAARFFLPMAALLPTVINAGCAQAQAPAGLPAQLTNVAKQSEAGAPFINTWLLLGTFDNDADNSGFNRAFIDETSAVPQDGQVVGGQSWRYFDDRLFSRNYDNYNDLFSYFNIKQNASAAAKVVYAHSYVYSPTAQNVQLRVGADTGFKAWVNGALVGGSTLAGPTDRAPGENQVLNGGRDLVVVPATLNQGWNRLLLKISNTENGRFGFYARVTTSEGNEPREVEYSVNGARGALAIENRAMPEAKTGALPIAWREWPYVEAKPDVETLIKLGSNSSGVGGQKPPAIPGIGNRFYYNRGTGMSASAFKLSSRGGQLPLVWSKIKGALPSGMTLKSDGTLSGTPSVEAKLGDYVFTAQVRDKAGKAATREYSLTLRERPNRAIEAGRLIGLVHAPQELSPDETRRLARLMKRRGYYTGVPTIYNNGDLLFRHPTAFAKKQTKTDVTDVFKKALEAEGVGFGIYTGPLDQTNQEDSKRNQEFAPNQQGLVLQEMLTRYPPKVMWFDWLGGESISSDSFFSIIRSIDSEIVIIMNGSERMAQGDWDILNFEGWGAWSVRAWNIWPADVPWPKKFTPSSWRYSVEPDWPLEEGISSDWREKLRVQLSLIGEGFIADIDHSASGSMGAAVSVHKGPFETRPLVINLENMANWTSPPGQPPLYEAFTNVDRGPLKAASYGYNTINLNRNAIYILALNNPHGKTGLPPRAALNIGALAAKVTSVKLMNNNSSVPFTQNASTRAVTIDTANIAQDAVASIFKITLDRPLTRKEATPPPLASLAYGALPTTPTPAGNLATGKPAWLLSADGTREFSSGAYQSAIYGVDGNPATFSMAGDEATWSYKVDLKAARTIRRIAVVFHVLWFATEYRILTSLDGTNWTQAVEAKTGQSGRHDFNIAPTEARWVRVQALKPDGPDQTGKRMGIGELQVFEKPLIRAGAQAENLAQGKTSRLLTADGALELGPSNDSIASNGVDGNFATVARASFQYAWSYGVDLGKAQTVRRIDITFGPGLWATEYNVLVSFDGQDWKTVAQVRDNTAEVDGAKSHTFAPIEARYVRVQALKPDGPDQIGTQMGIAELQVFDK